VSMALSNTPEMEKPMFISGKLTIPPFLTM
jgi:hypothetical protein